MFLCKVIGTVVSQEKVECLLGKKLLLCERKEGSARRRIVAVDLVGAGPGSEVLVSRQYQGNSDLVDELIVGIVDAVNEQS